MLDFFENHADKIKKINIKETFGFYKQLKDGTEGKILMFPDIEEMHTDERYVLPWVEYSTFDAEITYFLRETLAYQLCQLKTNEEDMKDMCGVYSKYWLPFGELLTEMERNGFRIDTGYLKEIELTAERDKIEYEQKFLSWVHKI
jgi:DNA polymerase-1